MCTITKESTLPLWIINTVCGWSRVDWCAAGSRGAVRLLLWYLQRQDDPQQLVELQGPLLAAFVEHVVNAKTRPPEGAVAAYARLLARVSHEDFSATLLPALQRMVRHHSVLLRYDWLGPLESSQGPWPITSRGPFCCSGELCASEQWAATSMMCFVSQVKRSPDVTLPTLAAVCRHVSLDLSQYSGALMELVSSSCRSLKEPVR